MNCKLFACFLLVTLVRDVVSQRRRQPRCEQGSCYPATGDLLIGRAENLTASSTCGMDRPSRYCVVSYLERDTKCFTCDSREPWSYRRSEESHRIENIVSSFKQNKRQRWWQAETGKEGVYIQLDLEAEFHFTHLIMTFRTFRPKAMLIERSFDFGRTWNVYRYFAQDCRKSFPHVRKRRVRSLTDVICEQKYSSETPSSKGEVIFRVLPPVIPIPDPYSETVQDLLKLTNLRINFTELHTLGDTLLDNRPEISEKYYYALYDVTVRGSCSCYGHASRCLPVPGYNRSEEISRNMIHGQCECTHNTKGLNCEQCEDFYHDHPWRPARPNMPNVCKKCNCNNHATECHFDAAKFTASGEISGGVCDNCQHNTMGVNCQTCKPFYYQDPNRDIRDPQICQPCDCDPHGSERNGLCDQVTDERAATVAGRCSCKAFVDGDRCDRCKENYWNLNADNPLGCEQCTCNIKGTIPDLGCDQETGFCRCKRYVIGKDCDECYPGFYGLSIDDKYGCKSCDCDIGGATEYRCNQATGQCDCRHHIQGQKCEETQPGFFYACLDHYKSEAEYGKANNKARVYIRKKEPDSPNFWTGSGYMKVFEGDSIEFSVGDLPFSTFYDIVIRYDPRMPETFEEVSVSVIRPAEVDPEGLCGVLNPRDDLKSTSLPVGKRYQVVGPASCLESGTTYTVRVDFLRYMRGRTTPEASMLIDSIVIVPNVDYIPIYQGAGLGEYMKQEFLHNRCDILQFASLKTELPEICKKHTFSISAVMHNGALDCNCDLTGSLSVECDPMCGQCKCKPNVVGRRCDQCAPGYYGFGPNGCKPCNCNQTGSSDDFCDSKTGQCTCIQNVDSRTCGQCRYGYWGFPQCRKCQCNGNSDICDEHDGTCINCRNFTTGAYCERCEDSYYGDPRIGVRLPCRPCMCPGGPNSPTQHADTCTFDRHSNEVYCDCDVGYRGPNCDTCIDNYYGDPTRVGGTCEPCVCNNNINPDMPGSCNSDTGECLICQHHTTGFACEHCETGYHGDATMQNCARCICNELGTNSSQGECDRVTGQCPCLPNVVGLSCDQCAPDHWDLGNEQGCQACGCDRLGATNSQCNQLDGQCDCVSGRGGPKCADCEDLQYGDPLDQCFPCDCNMQGSTGRQCDRQTGQCPCVEGVTGEKCDRCARGTTGDLPNCVPCGECFDNWDDIIQDLKVETHKIVKRASTVSVSGVMKAFDKEFQMMQNNLDDIKKILSSVNYTQGDIEDINNMLEMVKEKVLNNTQRLNEVDEDLDETKSKLADGKYTLNKMNKDVQKLRDMAALLKKNATDIQMQEISGAYERIKEAERDSKMAQQKVDATVPVIKDSERIRADTERELERGMDKFNTEISENEKNLDKLKMDVKSLEDGLTDINSMVCGSTSNTCNDYCGGGGCDICGRQGCNGAVSWANDAAGHISEIERLLKEKNLNATEQQIPKIQEAKREAMEAKAKAEEARRAAEMAKNVTEETNSNLGDVKDNIKEYLDDTKTASPESIKKTAEETLNYSLPMTASEINDLANQINKAIKDLKNIDQILNDTKESRKIAMMLQQRAQNASTDAKNILQNAEDVLKALNDTEEFQKIARQAIDEAKKDIDLAKKDFAQITAITEEVDDLSAYSDSQLDKTKDKLDKIKNRYDKLKADKLKTAEELTGNAAKTASEALKKAKELRSKYDKAETMVNDQFGNSNSTNERVNKLRDRAQDLISKITDKYNEVDDVKTKINHTSTRFDDISKKIDELTKQMDSYLKTIDARGKHYNEC